MSDNTPKTGKLIITTEGKGGSTIVTPTGGEYKINCLSDSNPSFSKEVIYHGAPPWEDGRRRIEDILIDGGMNQEDAKALAEETENAVIDYRECGVKQSELKKDKVIDKPPQEEGYRDGFPILLTNEEIIHILDAIHRVGQPSELEMLMSYMKDDKDRFKKFKIILPSNKMSNSNYLCTRIYDYTKHRPIFGKGEFIPKINEISQRAKDGEPDGVGEDEVVLEMFIQWLIHELVPAPDGDTALMQRSPWEEGNETMIWGSLIRDFNENKLKRSHTQLHMLASVVNHLTIKADGSISRGGYSKKTEEDEAKIREKALLNPGVETKTVNRIQRQRWCFSTEKLEKLGYRKYVDEEDYETNNLGKFK